MSVERLKRNSVRQLFPGNFHKGGNNMDAISQYWPFLLINAAFSAVTLTVFVLWTRRKRRSAITSSLFHADGTLAENPAATSKAAKAGRPCAARQLCGWFASYPLKFADWLVALPARMLDRVVWVVGSMASLVDPAVTRDKVLATRIADEQIAWRRRFRVKG